MSNEAVVHAHGAVTTHEGHDDHHHEHHHHETFISKYVFSQDHKMIAKQFLITGMFWGVIGGLMSLVFRLQLGFPEESMAWLKPVLGKWIEINAETGMGALSPDFYYALVTMHLVIMHAQKLSLHTYAWHISIELSHVF